MTRPKRHATPPTNGKKFVKGQSGNPGGRPKWAGDIKRLCQEHTQEAVDVLLKVMRGQVIGTKPSDINYAATYLLDRAHGKPAMSLHHSGGVTLTHEEALLALADDIDAAGEATTH